MDSIELIETAEPVHEKKRVPLEPAVLHEALRHPLMGCMNGTSLALFSAIWSVLALLLGAMEITIAVMLLKEKGAGPKLMLAGAVAGIVGNLGSAAINFVADVLGAGDSPYTFYGIVWAVSALGSLLFTVGLLLHVLHRRALATRIAELEAILESQNRS
jgi:hypothetical protein